MNALQRILELHISIFSDFPVQKDPPFEGCGLLQALDVDLNFINYFINRIFKLLPHSAFAGKATL